MKKELAVVWTGDGHGADDDNNDTLVVHLGRTRPVDGHIRGGATMTSAWVRRLQVLPSAWLLQATNKHYEPIKVPKDEQHTFGDLTGWFTSPTTLESNERLNAD